MTDSLTETPFPAKMETESGHIGTVSFVEWVTPLIKFRIGDAVVHEVNEGDILHILRDGAIWNIEAVELVAGDKIMDITPVQILIKKSLHGGLF